jgi:sigma-B regulation protein RsbU (phosphoserine phosphatase)
MSKSTPSHLKLHYGDETDRGGAEAKVSQGFELNNLLKAFAQATGWRIQASGQSGPREQQPAGRISAMVEPQSLASARMRLVPDAPMDGMLDISDSSFLSAQQDAECLLTQIQMLVQALAEAEATIERQEAQLAASMGVSLRCDESEALAGKLQETLHRATMQTASDASALYLLDESTSELKMRSCWGLHTSALSKPARPLRGSLADLEALMGNAVLLENTMLAQQWNCPEDFQAALCVPIGSPSTPHGTLWLWSHHVRDFSFSDIEAAKAAADKILVDIERSLLAGEVASTRLLSSDVELAGFLQSSRLPTDCLLHEDYEIAGWTFQSQSLGGNFHCWTLNRFGQIIAALGDAVLTGPAGAIVATNLQSTIESFWNNRYEPKQLMRAANDRLWSVPEGDWRCSLGYLHIDTATSSGSIAMAGSAQCFVVNHRGYRLVPGTPTFLGEQPDTTFHIHPIRPEAGELIVLVSGDLLNGLLHGGFTQSTLLEVLREMHEEPVQEICDRLARMLPIYSATDSIKIDRSLMILRRRL